MRSLFTLGFPKFNQTNSQWVDHNSEQKHIAPHFTLAFGISEVPDGTYLKHVEGIARKTAPINFECLRTTVGTDHRDTSGYSFLVPDRGNSALYSLHSALDSGVLSPYQDLRIPFIPHLTLTRHMTLEDAKQNCDRLNLGGVEVSGEIETIAVVALDGDALTTLEQFSLTGAR